jgi:hypothetical protein
MTDHVSGKSLMNYDQASLTDVKLITWTTSVIVQRGE